MYYDDGLDYKKLFEDPQLLSKTIREEQKAYWQREASSDKMYVNNVHERRLPKLKKLKMLQSHFLGKIKLDKFRPGLAIINDRYIVSLKSNRWQTSDGGTWYYYKNVKDLVERYILKEKDDTGTATTRNWL